VPGQRGEDLLGENRNLADALGEKPCTTCPELAVLVVRQSDGIPGQGWWVAGGARSRGYTGPWEGPEAARFIARVQAETFTFWRSGGDKGGTGDGD